jgi:ribosome-binding protein aMBF1 (putative translation factor)
MNKRHVEPARKFFERELKKSSSLRILYEEERAKTEIARLVRTVRERAGLTQRELAKRAQTTQAVIARLELGTDRRTPSIALIARLLHAAGAKLELAAKFGKSAA